MVLSALSGTETGAVTIKCFAGILECWVLLVEGLGLSSEGGTSSFGGSRADIGALEGGFWWSAASGWVGGFEGGSSERGLEEGKKKG